jgi:hypothetical protein
MIHTTQCKIPEHSDAAQRISDTYALHRLADPIGTLGKWFGVALVDGTSDGVLYDTRRDCVIHQKHNESYYAYICIVPSYLCVCDAEIFLNIQRQFFDKGIRMNDREHRAGGLAMIPRVTHEDQMRQVRDAINGAFNRR